MTLAIKACSTLLQRGGTTIAEVRDITGPGRTRTMPDVTSMDSTACWQEFIGTVIDGGSVSFNMNYVPSNATHLALEAAITSAAETYTLLFSDASTSTQTFLALVQDFTVNAAVAAELTADVTLKVTGAVPAPS